MVQSIPALGELPSSSVSESRASRMSPIHLTHPPTNRCQSQAWWYTPAIPEFGRLRQKDHKFKGYTARLCLNKTTTNKWKSPKNIASLCLLGRHQGPLIGMAVVELTIAFWDWSKREDDDPQWPACWKFWFSKGSLCYFLFIHAGNGTKASVLTVTLRGHFTDKKTKVE
jgi:hypothetical protein